MTNSQTIYRGLRKMGWTKAAAREMAKTINAAGGLYVSRTEIEGAAA